MTTTDYFSDFKTLNQLSNLSDPVPSTNDPLPSCAVTDVTKVRPSNIFGHDWPLVYYSNLHQHNYYLQVTLKFSYAKIN